MHRFCHLQEEEYVPEGMPRKCKTCHFQCHTGKLRPTMKNWIKDNGGSHVPNHCCHHCFKEPGTHGPYCEAIEF